MKIQFNHVNLLAPLLVIQSVSAALKNHFEEFENTNNQMSAMVSTSILLLGITYYLFANVFDPCKPHTGDPR